LVAFKTEPGLAGWSLIDSRTFFEEVSAGLIAGPAAWTLAAFEVVEIGEVFTADGAVHSAGRDQDRGDGIVIIHYCDYNGLEETSFSSQWQ